MRMDVNKEFAKWLFADYKLPCEQSRQYYMEAKDNNLYPITLEEWFNIHEQEIVNEYYSFLRSKITLNEYRRLVIMWKNSVKKEIQRLTDIIINVDAEGRDIEIL